MSVRLTMVENWKGWLLAVIRRVVSPNLVPLLPFFTIPSEMVLLLLLQERFPEMITQPFLRLVGWKVILLLPTVHLVVVEDVLVQLALYQVLAVVIVVVVELFNTLIVQLGWASPTPALLSMITLASRPSVRLKSNPSIYFPTLFQEFPVIDKLV